MFFCFFFFFFFFFFIFFVQNCVIVHMKMSQLMRLRYLSHRRPAKAQVSLRIRAVSPEPSLFAYLKDGSRQRVRSKIRHLAPLDGCACARLKNEFTEDEKYHNLMIWLKYYQGSQTLNMSIRSKLKFHIFKFLYLEF